MEENADRVLESKSKLGKALRHQKELLERHGVFGEIRLRHGLVVPELLKELQRGDYDLVVSGSSPAEQKIYRYVMGDVTGEIVNRAQLPVLVVRTGPRKIARLFKELLANLLGRFGTTSETPEG
jgi:nucleotide-binding universal stress UspA family protein